MRRTLTLLCLIVALVVFAPIGAQADPIVGDRITLTYGSSHFGSGGEFRVIGPYPTTAYDFETFCVETAEYQTPGNQYYIGGISQVTMDTNAALTPEVAYLYTQFRTNPGAIGYSDPYAGDLQAAIWHLMAGHTTSLGDAKDFVGQAMAAGWTNTGNVAVLNLYTSYNPTTGLYSGLAQDQLTLATPVPEPASLLLLGTGLVGLARWRRRRT